ncbi:thiolase family protein [Streptomyces sp. NPDC002659]|uniref:thiolase family protein n=1 Tax=Streptomyces sp. NPDC002659 TaxID=3364656 RepID=UPI00369AEBD3
MTLAAQAIRLAVVDAGLTAGDIDGLLIAMSSVAPAERMNLSLAHRAGLRDLRLLSLVGGEGTSAVQAIQAAATAVTSGVARAVVCVFSDTPIVDGRGCGAVFSGAGIFSSIEGLDAAYGALGWVTAYALAARRHLAQYGMTEEAFAGIVMAQRRWAQLNPQAMVRTPLTRDDYLASRWIVEPLRLADCAFPVNGAIAVIVVPGNMAASLKQPAVHIIGMGQGHPGGRPHTGLNLDGGGVPMARDLAFRMAGVSLEDIDACQFYDPFSYVTLVRLEDYGFCCRGEGENFVAAGRTGPGGALPANTGGGHLASYLQGMTPVAEGVIQVRGHAGARQIARRNAVLVTGDGGVLDYHACLIISPRSV